MENSIFCVVFSSIFNIFSTVIINYLTKLRVDFSLPREHTLCHNFRNSMNRICVFDKAVGTTKWHFLAKLHYTFFSTIKVLHMKHRRFSKILKRLTPIFTASKVSIFGVTLVHVFPHFPAFGVNTERYWVSPYSVWLPENAGKMRTRITPDTDTFYEVLLSLNGNSFTQFSLIKTSDIKLFSSEIITLS